MKGLLVLFSILFFFSFTITAAQPADSLNRSRNKFYVGIGVDLNSYSIYYKNPTITGPIASEYFTPVAVNVGYRLSDRISFQLGVAYGSKKENAFIPDFEPPDTRIERTYYSKTRVIALPLTTRLIFVDTYKRFPGYVTLRIMPAWGTTSFETREERANSSTTKATQDAGINLFATAGIGFKYKVWKRCTGYAEVHLIESDPTSGNSKYYGWRGENADYFKFIWAFGLGFNYNFR